EILKAGRTILYNFKKLIKNDFGAKDFTADLTLKSDHASRPLWVTPEGHIFLEAFSPVYTHAHDFLITISEPLSRPEFIHEYKYIYCIKKNRLTAYSLYAAVSVGLETNDIIEYLSRLSKTNIPIAITQFIQMCTLSYGKIKLVLKHSSYFVETEESMDLPKGIKTSQFKSNRAEVVSVKVSDDINSKIPIDISDYYGKIIRDELEITDIDKKVISFEIEQSRLEILQKRCIELDYPLLAEYDFQGDTDNPDISIDLKPVSILRPYQV
ncbi:hypothetical protein MXB_5495, partial [Myxobolus squamalis]